MPKLSADIPWFTTGVFFGRLLLRKNNKFQALYWNNLQWKHAYSLLRVRAHCSSTKYPWPSLPWKVTGSSEEAESLKPGISTGREGGSNQKTFSGGVWILIYCSNKTTNSNCPWMVYHHNPFTCLFQEVTVLTNSCKYFFSPQHP